MFIFVRDHRIPSMWKRNFFFFSLSLFLFFFFFAMVTWLIFDILAFQRESYGPKSAIAIAYCFDLCPLVLIYFLSCFLGQWIILYSQIFRTKSVCICSLKWQYWNSWCSFILWKRSHLGNNWCSNYTWIRAWEGR